MSTLMQRYLRHNERLRAAGVVLVAYACPCCSVAIETLPAPAGETWKTMGQCPHCLAVFWKVTTGAVIEAQVYRTAR
jgi:hypothetical protein